MEEIKSLIQKLRKSVVANIVISIVLVYTATILKTIAITYILGTLLIVNAVMILKRDKEVKKWGYRITIVMASIAIILATMCTYYAISEINRLQTLDTLRTSIEKLREKDDSNKTELEKKEEKKEEKEEVKKKENKEVKNKNFEVTDVTVDKGKYNTYVSGIVKNISNEEIRYLEVKIPVYDKQGNMLTQAWTNFTHLKPGQTWKFKANYYGSEKNIDIKTSELEVKESVY